MITMIEHDQIIKDALAAAEWDGCLQETLRYMCRTDLFFLLTHILNRRDLRHEWLHERCMEVQADPDGHLDLWAREHGKSSILTFGKTIQDILINPEETFGIFSHTKPIARAFLRQIKYELETNEQLKGLFPDILYSNPKKESKCWSEDNGIVVKRKNNPKESTIEAHGLIDGQPTSKHFSVLLYDDVVTRESVTSPEMIKKTTEAWELSLNLGARGGRRRYIGTHYHFNDTYATMKERGSAIPRVYPATDNGKVTGKPVLLSQDILEEKRRDMGTYVYACQMLLNPLEDAVQGFKPEWIKRWDAASTRGLNLYIIVDPANAKRKTSDYTVFWVIGLGSDKNYYVVDCVRDRLNLTERTEKLIELHQIYQPEAVGYEHYGMQADIQHIEYVQEQKNYRFPIIPLGGSMPKVDRIRRMVPVYEFGRMYLPYSLIKTNREGRTEDLMKVFLDQEYTPFPVMAHDDMFDGQSRILDDELGATFPAADVMQGGVSRFRQRMLTSEASAQAA